MADAPADRPTCPRCGGELEVFVFDGARAVGCADCGYADVPADLSPAERVEEESWASILRRYRRGGDATVDADGDDGNEDDEDEENGNDTGDGTG